MWMQKSQREGGCNLLRPENKELLQSIKSPILEGVELSCVVIRYRFKSRGGGIFKRQENEKKKNLPALSKKKK